MKVSREGGFYLFLWMDDFLVATFFPRADEGTEDPEVPAAKAGDIIVWKEPHDRADVERNNIGSQDPIHCRRII